VSAPGPLAISCVEGRGLPLRGDDVDTDRIMPARFLRAVTFDGLERHVFEDDRAGWPGDRGCHPFDDPAYAGAAVLVVNTNFGCGSSREHAPQGLLRWGIRACVGASFSEIFFANALAIGLPCVRVTAEAAAHLQAILEGRPATTVSVDLAARAVRAGDWSTPASMPDAALDAFLTGSWDATGLLMVDPHSVAAVAARLPYITGF
jgi:3-isopropylmalate/(R)-2-methylmalate dehydratase small subunit